MKVWLTILLLVYPLLSDAENIDFEMQLSDLVSLNLEKCQELLSDKRLTIDDANCHFLKKDSAGVEVLKKLIRTGTDIERAKYNLAVYYSSFPQGSNELAEAKRLYKSLVGSSVHVSAVINLGVLFANENNLEKAIELYRKYHNSRNDKLRNNLGVLLLRSENALVKNEGIQLLNENFRNGSMISGYSLASLYLNSDNCDKAEPLINQLVNNRYEKSSLVEAAYVFNGCSEVQEKYERVASLLGSRNLQELTKSEKYMLYASLFKIKKYSRAIEGLEELAELGNKESILLLAKAHWNGVGVPKDSIKGFNYYKFAARSGVEEALDFFVFIAETANNEYLNECIKKVKKLSKFNKSVAREFNECFVNQG